MTFISTNNLKDTPDIQVYQAVGKRDTQQDCYVVARLDTGILLAVADGHGGGKASSIIAALLPALFHGELERAFKDNSNSRYSGLSDTKIRGVVRRTIQSLTNKTQDMGSGSTLTMVFLEQGTRRIDNDYSLQIRATVGQMGDSVFALSAKPGHLCVAPMHSVFDAKKDVEEIKASYLNNHGKECKCGSGYIYSSGNGVDALALTRSLGDKNFTLIRKPEVKTYTAAPDQAVLLLASDGIFSDPSNPRRCIRGYVDQLQQGKSVAEIGEGIQYMHDNTTIIGARF